jgi:phosphocarrier protein
MCAAGQAVPCSQLLRRSDALLQLRFFFRVWRSSGVHIRLSENQFQFYEFIKESKFMCIKDVMVQNQVGLHARPATFFIQKANEFRSAIWIEKEERRVNAKSLLGILSLGIVGGTAIRIIADGTDEEQAVASLVELVDSGFSDESR